MKSITKYPTSIKDSSSSTSGSIYGATSTTDSTLGSRSSNGSTPQSLASGTLHLLVIRALGLRKTPLEGGISGPYLSVTAGGERFKTKVDRKRKRNPIWNEKFVFGMFSLESPDNREISFQVKNKRLAFASRVVGEAKLTFQDIISRSGNVVVPIYAQNSGEETGEIEVKAYFEPDNMDQTEVSAVSVDNKQPVEDAEVIWPNDTMEEEINQISDVQSVLQNFYKIDGESIADYENDESNDYTKKSSQELDAVLTKDEQSSYMIDKYTAVEEQTTFSSSEETDSLASIPLNEVVIIPFARERHELDDGDYSVCSSSDDEDDYEESTCSSYSNDSEIIEYQHEMNLNHIISIGFSLEAAERALEKSQDDAKLAVQLLMDGEVPLNGYVVDSKIEQEDDFVSESSQPQDQWEGGDGYDTYDESSVGLNYFDPRIQI